MNFKQIVDFITPEEKKLILDQQFQKSEVVNEHIKKINEATKGYSVLCDLSKTEVSKQVSSFQGDNTQVTEVHPLFLKLVERIGETLSLPTNHVFFQYIFLGVNGKVGMHYDAGLPGYITYKCNVYVDGPDDCIYVNKQPHAIKQGDLYCFEANFYRHSMKATNVPRVHLSYGLLIPYSVLGYTETHPRVRLSNRIYQNFIEMA